MLRTMVCAVGLCALSLLLLVPAESRAQVFDAETYYQLRARNSGRCLDLPFGSASNAVQLQQWDCNALAQVNQLWTIVPTGTGLFRIVSANSAKCVDVRNYSLLNTEAIQQYDCNLAILQANQVFYVTGAPTAGYYRIFSAQSQSAGAPKCLDVAGFSGANGALIQQYDCGPVWQSNQDWEIVPFVDRQPLTQLRHFGYYFGVPLADIGAMRDYVNYTQAHPLAGLPSSATYAAAGIKVKLSLFSEDAGHANYSLFRYTGRNGEQYDPTKPFAGPCPLPPASNPDDIYSRCDNEGGLRIDWLAIWNNNLKPLIAAHQANISMFYFDEPYTVIPHRHFSHAMANDMMTIITAQIKADFPTIPIVVVVHPTQITLPEPPSVDWLGVYCYDFNVNGIPGCLDGAGVSRTYGDLMSILKSYNPGKKLVLVANGAQTNPPGNQAQLISAMDYFTYLALADPDVRGIFIWEYGAAPAVKAKHRFISRALGFGCVPGYPCP